MVLRAEGGGLSRPESAAAAFAALSALEALFCVAKLKPPAASRFLQT